MQKRLIASAFPNVEIEMLNIKFVCAGALTAMMIVPAIAEEAVKEEKGKGEQGRNGHIAKIMIKQLSAVNLTEE